MVCCFFGHHDASEMVKDDLYACVLSLIENDGVDSFLVGNHGHFDGMVLSALRKEKKYIRTSPIALCLPICPKRKRNTLTLIRWKLFIQRGLKASHGVSQFHGEMTGC